MQIFIRPLVLIILGASGHLLSFVLRQRSWKGTVCTSLGAE